MTDTDNLRDLADAVEAGEPDLPMIVAMRAFPPASTPSFRLSGQYMQGYEAVYRACHGDLNAAVRLVEALLPGWVWETGTDYAGAGATAIVRNRLPERPGYRTEAANPARALRRTGNE